MKRTIFSLSVVFLILLCNWHCNAQKSCITTSGLYGFCHKSFRNNAFFNQNPDCGDHELCFGFERSLNATGVTILRNMYQNCGKINGDHVAGGTNALFMEFTWMAILRQDGNICAGTLITNRWVLTAAHCIKAQFTSVTLGEYDLSKNLDCPSVKRVYRKHCAQTKTVAIEKIVSHPDYDETRLIRDIALIKLREYVPFSNSISPVCLPIYQHHAERPADDVFSIAGWGLTETGYVSAILQKAEVTLVETDECNKRYPRVNINRSHICARGHDGPNVGTCRGDSGGPLFKSMRWVQSHTVRRHIQVGVISHGNSQCGVHPFPYPYASVIDAMPWITSVIDG